MSIILINNATEVLKKLKSMESGIKEQIKLEEIVNNSPTVKTLEGYQDIQQLDKVFANCDRRIKSNSNVTEKFSDTPTEKVESIRTKSFKKVLGDALYTTAKYKDIVATMGQTNKDSG